MNDIIPVEILDVQDFNIPKSDLKIDDIVKLELLVKDYNQMRETVLSNVEITNQVIQSLTTDMFTADSVTPEMVSAYSSLIDTSNKSLKILTESYKNISNVLLNINKLKSKEPKETKENDNVFIISTSDMIKKIKNLES